jgi:type II secretory pathway pseudopilin PulG
MFVAKGKITLDSLYPYGVSNMHKNSLSVQKSISETLKPLKNMATSQNACSRRKLIQLKTYQHPNRETGYYLIEALICCLIVGIMTAGLADGYARIKSFSTHSQTELQAVAISEECIDQLRSQQFSFLLTQLGQHNVLITGTSPNADPLWQNSLPQPLFPRPLLRDTSLTYYSNVNTQTDDTNNYLHATNNQVMVNLTGQNDNTTILATVTITWSDGNGTHTYTVETTLTSNGLNG